MPEGLLLLAIFILQLNFTPPNHSATEAQPAMINPTLLDLRLGSRKRIFLFRILNSSGKVLPALVTLTLSWANCGRTCLTAAGRASTEPERFSELLTGLQKAITFLSHNSPKEISFQSVEQLNRMEAGFLRRRILKHYHYFFSSDSNTSNSSDEPPDDHNWTFSRFCTKRFTVV